MIAYCRNYLVGILKNTVQIPPTAVFTKAEDASRYKGLIFALVTPERERLQKDGTRVAKEDDLENNQRRYRYRLYKSTLPVVVTIVAKDLDQAETFRQRFIKGLGFSFKDPEGNAIEIEATGCLTIEEESIQNPREGYEITVQFTGGIYQDQIRTLVSTDIDPETETK
ncbi:MAG: hypothetical protein ACM3YE_17225 [Bacteroidota bacterium]